MKEPNVQKQIDESIEQYKDGLITKKEHEADLARISHNYNEWVERNEK